ncbi:MAG: hypothetical protein ACM3X9_02765 [Bacillota bacterium]
MIKKLWLIFLILILSGFSAGLTKDQLELVAPGGGELDLGRNVMVYHGTATKPVEVRWQSLILNSKYLEYNRNNETLFAKSQAQITQKLPFRTLKANEISVKLKQESLAANGGVSLKYDDTTTVTCNMLKWDQKNDLMELSGQPIVIYKEWTIKGVRMEGHPQKGLFIVYGPAEAANKTSLARGGKMTFDRDADKLVIQENPDLVRGKNEMSANEIVYDLKTNQVLASGTVKTRIVEETE